MAQRVLLVGHCLPDSFSLKRALKRAAPEADATRVNSRADLEAHLADASLLLVNRVLDGRFGVASGVDLIRELREANGGAAVPMILVSNFEDAQAEATEAGAQPGFGKNDLRTTGPERIAAALEGAASSSD